MTYPKNPTSVFYEAGSFHRFDFDESEIVEILVEHLGTHNTDQSCPGQYGEWRFAPAGNNERGPIYTLLRQYHPTKEEIARDLRERADGIEAGAKS